jgi:hypothetical protein
MFALTVRPRPKNNLCRPAQVSLPIKIGLMIPLVGNQSRINSTDRIGQYPKGYEDSCEPILIPLKTQDH